METQKRGLDEEEKSVKRRVFVACCVLDSGPMTLERGTKKVRQGWVRSSSIPVSSRYHIHVPVPGSPWGGPWGLRFYESRHQSSQSGVSWGDETRM
jgi:hypothetical protein